MSEKVIFYNPSTISLRIKARTLWLLQRIIQFHWKYIDKKTSRVWNATGYRIEKRSCPQLYLKRKGYQTIAIDLFYSFGGFYKQHGSL